MPVTSDQGEARDRRQAERGLLFKRFAQGEAIPNFFEQELIPMFRRHYIKWLEDVKGKRAGPEVLTVLDDLMATFTETIKLGEMAAERITERRMGKLVGVKS